jgi:hypothetical protein
MFQPTNHDTDKQCSKLIHVKQQIKLMGFQNPIQTNENNLNDLRNKISIPLRNRQYMYNKIMSLELTVYINVLISGGLAILGKGTTKNGKLIPDSHNT